MTEKSETGDCGLMSWAMAAMAAFLAFVLLIVLGDWRLISAIFVSLVMFGALGLAFSTIFCAPLPGPVLPGGMPSAARPAAAPPMPMAAPSPAAAPLAAPITAGAVPEPEPEPVAVAEPEPAAEAASVAEPEPEAAPDSPAEDPAPVETPIQAPILAEAEPQVEGVRPRLLDAAPEDGGDDLKRIKGIGPKLEQLCNSLGIYRFDQIAAWTEAEVAWVDSNLEGFKGRVTRDAWVSQARDLAGGGSGA